MLKLGEQRFKDDNDDHDGDDGDDDGDDDDDACDDGDDGSDGVRACGFLPVFAWYTDSAEAVCWLNVFCSH